MEFERWSRDERKADEAKRVKEKEKMAHTDGTERRQKKEDHNNINKKKEKKSE